LRHEIFLFSLQFSATLIDQPCPKWCPKSFVRKSGT